MQNRGEGRSGKKLGLPGVSRMAKKWKNKPGQEEKPRVKS